MGLVSSICSFEATPRRKGAEGGIWGLIHRPYLTRQSLDALDTLRPRQRLTGRGSVVHDFVGSVGREGRHDDRWCHARQREKRGVSQRGGTLRPDPTAMRGEAIA